MAGGLAVVDWSGTAPGRLFLAHATGFCKEVWEPVVDELHELGVETPITAWDAPSHGDSAAPAGEVDWWDTARAALAVVATRVEDRPRVGVGHSMGGASLVLAELLEPGTFDGLVLIEPIIFPPPFRAVEENPLSAVALRRRPSFDSPAQALANFASKPAFQGWDERALHSYVRGGLVERSGRWWLKCDPAREAETYRAATRHGAYARLDEVACPVTILAGEHSDTHPEPFVADLAARFERAGYRIVGGSGHFLPMENPARVAEEVRTAARPVLDEARP